MNRKALLLTGILVVAALLLAQISLAQGELGSEDNPIQVFFVPSVEAGVIVTGGEIMADFLQQATGLNYEVVVPTSYAATVEAMCAAPESSMGFIPAAGYVIANNRCGVEVAAAAVRFGWPVYWAQYIVRRDSDIFTFGDLDGKVWAYPDPSSTSGFIVPSVELQAKGIGAGDTLEAGGHPQAVLAVVNGEADFATTFFSPPLTPGAAWNFGDPPEPYDLTVDESFLRETDSGSTQLWVGDVRILDARSAVRETVPDVVEQVRILGISDPIPNDTLSFGPGFPEELRAQIMDALQAFSQTEEWSQSIGSEDFYSWSGLAPITDEVFDSVRRQFEILGLTEQDIFAG